MWSFSILPFLFPSLLSRLLTGRVWQRQQQGRRPGLGSIPVCAFQVTCLGRECLPVFLFCGNRDQGHL